MKLTKLHSTLLICIISMVVLNLPAQAQWSQIGSDIDGEDAFDNSGHSISMNGAGNTVIIGAPGNAGSFSGAGHARVYELISGNWIQKGNDLDGEAQYDGSGIAVAMNETGNIIAIGAVSNDDGGSGAGHVRIYEWSGTAWTQKGSDIDGEAQYNESGNSIQLSADGNTIVIGASKNDDAASNAGHTRVYEWNGSMWIQKGSDIDGDAANDAFGYSVSISADGNIISIGAPMNSGLNVNGGQVKIYEWNSSSSDWIQKGSDIHGEANYDRFGFSVDLSPDGNTLAVGAIMNDGGGTDAGHVRVFEWNGGAWAQKGDDIDGEAYDDNSGCALALSYSGDTVAIGAKGNDGTVGTNAVAGHVRIYWWTGSFWSQISNDIDGESDPDYSGQSVALSLDGSTVAIGAHWNSGNGTSSGHVRVFGAPSNVGIFNIQNNDLVQVYPNPTTGSIQLDLSALEFNSNDFEIRLKNVLGQTVGTQVSQGPITTMEINGSPGIYFIEILNESHKVSVQKVVKQ